MPVLDAADSIRVGVDPVDRVYVGSTQIWSRPVGGGGFGSAPFGFDPFGSGSGAVVLRSSPDTASAVDTAQVTSAQVTDADTAASVETEAVDQAGQTLSGHDTAATVETALLDVLATDADVATSTDTATTGAQDHTKTDVFTGTAGGFGSAPFGSDRFGSGLNPGGDKATTVETATVLVSHTQADTAAVWESATIPGQAAGITERTPTRAENNGGSSVQANTANAQTGDLMLIVGAAANAVSISSGWTPLFTPTTYAGNGYGAWYRWKNGQAADTPTVTGGASGRVSALVAAFGGVHATTPFDVAVAVGTSEGSTSLGLPAITTVTANALVVISGAVDATGVDYTLSGPSASYPQDIQTAGQGRRQALAAAVKASPGPTGAFTWTQASGVNLMMIGFTLALKPAGVTVPGSSESGPGSAQAASSAPELAFAIIDATTTPELTTAKANGANYGLVEVKWDQCQSTLNGAVDASAVLANITRIRDLGMGVVLRVSLQYLPGFVDTAAVKFVGRNKAGATSTHDPGNVSGWNARDWVWSASTRALVNDFLNKLFAQLDWSKIDRVQAGGGPAGELQFPDSDGTVWWGFSTPAQNGTDLAAGMSAAPTAGYVPNTGTTWNASDQAFVDWYTDSLNRWMLWLIGKYRAYFNGPIWVMHPGSGLRKTSMTPTGSFALAYRQAVAKGTDWDTQIAAYPDGNVWPYSTWSDAPHAWDPDPYSDVNDGNAAGWYHLLRIARARGRAWRIWGENTGGQTLTDLTRMFTSGSVALGYGGLLWLKHADLVAGTNVSYAQLAAKITTVSKSVGPFRRGVNMAGGEFGDEAAKLPGTYDVDYHYDATASYTAMIGRGHRLLRVPFRAERVQPTRGGALNTTEVNRITARADAAAAAGAVILPDCHNYGRWINSTANGGATLVLGDTWPISQFVDLWTRLSAVWKDHPGIWGYGLMNEPHDLPTAAGSFTGTVRYDFSDGVQGWTGDTATATWQSGAQTLRLSGTANATGFWNMRKDDAALKRGGTLTGAVLRVKATLGAAVTGSDWKLIPQWQNASFQWINPTATSYTRVDNGATVSGLVAGVAVWVQATFASITSPNAFAVQVESNTATNGQAVTVDIDDFAQGSATSQTGAQLWESASQQVLTALRTAGDTGLVVCSGHGWSGCATWPDEHPAAWLTDPANNHCYEGHHYFDRDRSGDYPDTYAAEYTWAQGQGASGLGSWATWGLQRFGAWCRANGVRGLIGEIGWPNIGDTVGWNSAANLLYAEMDRFRLHGTYWATGEWWGEGYNLSAYTGTNLATAKSPATVIEAHPAGT